MAYQSGTDVYFPYEIQISSHHWHSLDLGMLSHRIQSHGIPRILFFRQLALKLNSIRPDGADTVHAGELNLYATFLHACRHIIDVVVSGQGLSHALKQRGIDPAGRETRETARSFVNLFPPDAVLKGVADEQGWLEDPDLKDLRTGLLLREMLLLRLAADNPAIESFRELVDDSALVATSQYTNIVNILKSSLTDGPVIEGRQYTLIEALLAVINSSPASLAGQVGYIRSHWHSILPPEILSEAEIALDILNEEQRERGFGGGDPGPAPVLEFGGKTGSMRENIDHMGGGSVFAGYDYPEYEQFSPDADWMSNVVLMAKMVYIWLDQLSRMHGYPITRLDQVPDAELDRLAAWGFTGLWLIGLWERSPASQRIKQICGNPDAIASAYSLYDYEVAADLGGWDALASLRARARKRGIRLASDMVPNHTGIYSRWVIQHPDWFVQTDYPPFPTYRFNGEDLSHDTNVCLQIEDGYWNKSDAAVVFRHYDRRTDRTRFIYHGNDGTSIPWNDTAQLNYLIPEVRESVIQTILHVARNFPIIRFDAAMTLAKKHYQRLWFPLRGLGGGVPSRVEHGMSKEEFDTVFPVEFWREVVDRVAAEASGTLLLAEAFWMMEGYFVRTLGMHRVYNSAFMNMLKTEENAKYRQTIKNVLEFNHEILKRFVNFMNNPDEKTAVAQFGSQGKYFGACVLLATMPGLPMIGHGQIEGFHEKYGMEYKRAYWDEQVDEGLVRGHEMWIFPLLRRRWLFSGSENFVLYDFHTVDSVDENVFAYSNRVNNQRALVLFNNRHATTSGWIRESVFFDSARDGVEQKLARTTLSDALQFGFEENTFITFRDLTQGHEYLRSASELNQNGLYVELGEYQFHVFMDFNLVKDDAKGSWRSLYTHLNGSGVESLADERKQLEYAKLNSLFRNLLRLIPLSGARKLVEPAQDDLPQAIDDFLAALADELTKHQTDKNAARSSKLRRAEDGKSLAACFDSLQKLLAQKPKAADALMFQTRVASRFTDQATTRLVLAWLVLRSSSVNPVRYGLDWVLKQLLAKDHDRDLHYRSTQLLVALQELWQFHGKATVKQFNTEHIASMFMHPASRSYLMVHESEGTEWFNKERFEELCEWGALLVLLDGIKSVKSPVVICSRMASAELAISQTAELAKRVGYKSALFTKTISGIRARSISSAKKTAV
ncbi:MAG: alpha-amylase [Geobacteraceae bacterium GWC2_55_20]|nr:MAG: alpha-amylase [Geobacteraceae bacterium GWC2_55_20]OGU20209.1 MAG: alpha-amylase [Geobacteraceae bacterium GWF2_54_21]HCE66483.1 alpha-amylase [Geobacter sp.]